MRLRAFACVRACQQSAAHRHTPHRVVLQPAGFAMQPIFAMQRVGCAMQLDGRRTNPKGVKGKVEDGQQRHVQLDHGVPKRRRVLGVLYADHGVPKRRRVLGVLYADHDSSYQPQQRPSRLNVAGLSPVPAQMWKGRAQLRRRCGRVEPSPGADVAGASPVPAQTWQGRAQSRHRCGRAEPSSGADAAVMCPAVVCPAHIMHSCTWSS